MDKPILSICIPTYNRVSYLVKSLNSLISQPEFSQIEVVISDNASTDGTEEICKSFQKKYPNIVYYKNKENTYDQNFPTALMRAKGSYRKLCNDTSIFEIDFLSYILRIIETYNKKKPFLFFLNEQMFKKKVFSPVECDNLNDFCLYTGRWLTWIGGFGLWEDYCHNLNEEYPICRTRLWQAYKALKIVSDEKYAIILPKRILSIQDVKNKDFSYGIYTVFYKNFPSILKPYLDNEQLSLYTFKEIKKDLLYSQAGKYFFKQSNIYELNNQGKRKNCKNLILKEYKYEPYYLHFLIKYFFDSSWITFLKILKKNPIGQCMLKLKKKLKLKLY